VRSTKAVAIAAAVIIPGYCTGIAHADPNPPPGPKSSIGSDGTYAVGTDIVPGTYTSAGPVGDGTCYWKRVKGNDLVDNALTKKAQVVQIDATDTAFKTSGCQPWQLSDCLPGCAPPQQTPLGMLGDLKDFLGPHLGSIIAGGNP
jgi:hypothetical protein